MNCRGFTLIELIASITIIAILAAVALPRMTAATPFAERGYADGIAASLRQSRAVALASGCAVQFTIDAAGYRAFKLKVGFGAERDVANLAAMREALGPDATIMCDANQAWNTTDDAVARIAELAPYRPLWIEEPIPADCPHDAWRSLAASSAIPLAAGENLRGQQAFDEAVDAGYLRFVQPDVGKWGGISGGIAIARNAATRGIAYCPHWLAGGIGLAASMHALAGSGNTLGYAEVDANPNPLREDVFRFAIEDGCVTLADAPGLGFEPDLAALESWAA